MIRALILWLLPCLALAGEATINWTHPTLRVDGSAYTNPGGYKIWERCGTDPLALLATVPHPQATYVRSGAPDGVPCFWSLTAFDTTGIESARTNEASRTFPQGLPGAPANLFVTWSEGSSQVAFSIIGTPAYYDNGGAVWNTTNFTWPTVNSGDLAVVMVSYYENTNDNAWNTPTGFTSQVDSVVSGSGSAESRFRVYTKVANGTEDGTSLTVGRTGNAFATAIFAVVRGAASLSVAAAPTVSAADGTSPISASTVTASTDEGILYFVCDDSGAPITEDAGVTVILEGPANGTNGGGIYFEDLSTTGTTTARSFSWTGSSTFMTATMRVAGVGFTGGGGGGSPAFRMSLLGVGR